MLKLQGASKLAGPGRAPANELPCAWQARVPWLDVLVKLSPYSNQKPDNCRNDPLGPTIPKERPRLTGKSGRRLGRRAIPYSFCHRPEDSSYICHSSSSSSSLAASAARRGLLSPIKTG